MGSHVVIVLSDRSFLDVEAGKAEHLLLENAKVLIRQLTHEQLLCIAGVAGITVAVLHSSHPLVELVATDAQCLTEIQCVKPVPHLIHHNHNVIRRLIEHHQFAVTVGDITTRGIFYLLQESVRVGTLLVVITRDLKRE